MTLEAAMGIAIQHHRQGRLAEAERIYRQILAQQPENVVALRLIALIAADCGKLPAAADILRHALAIKPDFAEAHFELGNVLRRQGQMSEAAACYRKATEFKIDFVEAYQNLGAALTVTGYLDEAAEAFRQAVRLRPNAASTYSNLGATLAYAGRAEEATNAFEKAMALDPKSADFESNRVYSLNFHPGFDGPSILREQQNWAEHHATPFARLARPHENDRSPDRRLRIGYVSPNFCDHVVGRNMLPLLREHDRDQFEAWCYSDAMVPDAVTDSFKAIATEWRDVGNVGHDQLAERVREDKIDVLVDLSLHLANNRLLTFACRPAPVQVTFAGYPGGTGLDAIGYRLTDPYLDPITSKEGDFPTGPNDAWYVERSIRLPHSFWCYEPSIETESIVPVSNLPAARNGLVTFGCLNNFNKVNEQVLRLWSRVLRSSDQSRLIVLAPSGSHRDRTLRIFHEAGVAPDRIEFLPKQPREIYFKSYGRIDISLDTYPYNGHTTSLDSLWMGVPVVTKVGTTAVACAGFSQLSNLGLRELVAYDDDQYVTIAASLAANLDRLAALRSSLRQRMLASPLMDAKGFTQAIESAYRKMWRRWCSAML